ncbi:hypothetical protein EMIT0P228_40372 [Pseudomonas brassicacearum]
MLPHVLRHRFYASSMGLAYDAAIRLPAESGQEYRCCSNTKSSPSGFCRWSWPSRSSAPW